MLTQPKGGPPSLCSQLLVDELVQYQSGGRNRERKGTIRFEDSTTAARIDRRVAAQVESACGWAGWRPSSRGMGDGASLGTAPKPQRRWSQSGFCRSLRSPHEATWSLHVGTHQPEHALHIVRKNNCRSKIKESIPGVPRFSKCHMLFTKNQTTRRMPTCANDNKIQVLGPSTHVGSKSALNHRFPTTESLLARWAASGGPTQKESTTPNTLISSKLVPNWIHQLHISSRRKKII